MNDKDVSTSIRYLLSAIFSYRDGDWSQEKFFEWVDKLKKEMYEIASREMN